MKAGTEARFLHRDRSTKLIDAACDLKRGAASGRALVIRRTVWMIVLLFLVGTCHAAWGFSSDPNDWATAWVDGPWMGPAGTYTSTWTVQPNYAEWPDGSGASDEWLLVGLEFQPDGGLSAYNNVPQASFPSIRVGYDTV